MSHYPIKNYNLMMYVYYNKTLYPIRYISYQNMKYGTLKGIKKILKKNFLR